MVVVDVVVLTLKTQIQGKKDPCKNLLDVAHAAVDQQSLSALNGSWFYDCNNLFYLSSKRFEGKTQEFTDPMKLRAIEKNHDNFFRRPLKVPPANPQT